MNRVGSWAGPAIVALVAGIVFAVLRPALSTGWSGGWWERLEWAALGGVLGLAGALAANRIRTSPLRASAVLAVVVSIVALIFSFAQKVDRLASTMLTVVLAVAIVGSLWIFLNLVLGMARREWRGFVAVVCALAAAVGFAILRGNISLTALVAEPDLGLYGAGAGWAGRVEWPIFGALLWGGGVFLMHSLHNRWLRVAIGIALGAVTGWFIGTHSLVWQRPTVPWLTLIISMLVCAAIAVAIKWRPAIAAAMRTPQSLAASVITGLGIGAMIGTWLLAPFAGSENDAVIAAALPLALLGARIAWNQAPSPARLAAFENRSQGALFLGPALLFLSAALVIPAIRTIILSTLDRNFDRVSFEGNTFDGFNAEGDAYIGFDNYRTLLNDVDSFDVSNWQAIFSSQLFWVAAALIVTGLIIGLVTGTRRNGNTSFVSSGSSLASIGFGALLFSFAVFSVLRGTFFNNLWWVVTVTTVSVVLGLTIAVLAERAGRLESVAKSLIFMPMAISFVGASIVWRLQYQPRDPTKPQTGVLNATWVQIGRLSHSGAPRIIVLVLLGIGLALVGWRAARSAMIGQTFGAWVGGLIVLAYLFIELARRSLGGFRLTNGEVFPDTIVFLQEPPFNNVFLMVILIWIQTGFAMVILSAAIKAVPPELTEAARVDGASESQTFFQVVLPQILPTVAVITTTLIVLVTKVFDIVKVSTGGNFGTNVLANDMYEVSFSFGNFTLGSAIATLILVSVLPVMFINVRRMQQARV